MTGATGPGDLHRVDSCTDRWMGTSSGPFFSLFVMCHVRGGAV